MDRVRNININELIGIVKDRFILALLIDSDEEQAKVIEDILNEIASNVIPNRPNRSIERNPNPRKSKFHHNRKRNS